MTRIVRVIALVLGGVALLVTLVLAALLLLIDPNDYRQQISQIAHEKAGITLTLGGDLGWRFYPVLGFEAHSIRLALQPKAPALMQVKSLVVGVKLLPLLSKQIEVDGVQVDGLQAHLIVHADGSTNWQRTTASVGPSPADKAGAPGPLSEVRIPVIRLTDARLRYEDRRSTQDYTVDIPRFQLTDVALEESFPLQLDARVAGISPTPITFNASGSLALDQLADKATLTLDTWRLAEIKGALAMSVTDLGKTPVFSGRLTTGNFNVKSVLKSLGLDVPQTHDGGALRNARADLPFQGTPQRIRVQPLTLVLDDSTLTGSVQVNDMPRLASRFDLTLDTFNLDRYLAPAPESPTATSSSTASRHAPADAEPLLPVDALRALNLQGTLRVGEGIVHGIALRQVGFGVHAREGVVRLTDVRADLLEGSLQGDIGVDVRGNQPKLTSTLSLNELKTELLLAAWTKTPLLSGRGSLRVDASAQGNDRDTLLRQALGNIHIRMADGQLHGVNLNALVVEALKQKIGDITVLMPDYETRLPKGLKNDTPLRQLVANLRIENGLLLTPDLKADSGSGQLTATGDIDLLSQAFDYRFGVALTALEDHKYLKGQSWPVRCRGSLATPAREWCAPDSQAIAATLKTIAATALRDKANEKLGEKLGVPVTNEAEVRKKAEEKVNQEINRQVDKWLNRNKP